MQLLGTILVYAGVISLMIGYGGYVFTRYTTGGAWTGRRFRWLMWFGGGGIIAIAVGALMV